jgi:hypothetical protein
VAWGQRLSRIEILPRFKKDAGLIPQCRNILLSETQKLIGGLSEIANGQNTPPCPVNFTVDVAALSPLLAFPSSRPISHANSSNSGRWFQGEMPMKVSNPKRSSS